MVFKSLNCLEKSVKDDPTYKDALSLSLGGVKFLKLIQKKF